MSRRTASLLILAALLMGSLLPLPAQAGGFCHDGGTTQGDTTNIDMKGNCFSPTVTTIDVGDKVTWANYDKEAHVVVGAGGSWGTDEVAPSRLVAVRFDKPGVYPYWCHLHLGMVGAVVVGDGKPTLTAGSGGGDDGPAATTLSTGSDTIADLDEASTSETAPSELDDAEPASAVGVDWQSLGIAAGVLVFTGLLCLGASSGGRRRHALLATKKMG
jgi:plastocyanin